MKSDLLKKEKYIQRLLLDELMKWIDRKEVLAIKGPRQSGKTTLLKMLKNQLVANKKIKEENIILITFEERDILEKFAVDPKMYIQSFIGDKQEKRFYFFIDEFQYLSNGGQILKMLYDIFDNVKFIITGSSSLELTDKTAKFLVGRIFFFHLWQLNFAEFIKTKSTQLSNAYQKKSNQVNNFITEGKSFSVTSDIFINDLEKVFQEYAIWGGYPAVVQAPNPETKNIILKNIYSTYIDKDIIELLKITDHSKFKKLVSVLSAQIGNLANYNSLSRDTGTYFKELKQYLSILEETYIISLLRPFFSNKISELKKNPKVYFIDSGLRNYITGGIDGNLIFRQDLGAIMENVVFSQFKFKEEVFGDLKYWRTLGKAEVDFIIEMRDEVMPIEVKYTTFNSPQISRGFRSFIQEYKPKRALILTKNFWGEMEVDSCKIKFAPLWYL